MDAALAQHAEQARPAPGDRGDQFLFHLTALDLHGDIIVIGADESAAALKVRNFHQLGFRKVKNTLNTLGFLLFQIQQDLRFAVVDDALAIFTVVQRKKSLRSCVAQTRLPP